MTFSQEEEPDTDLPPAARLGSVMKAAREAKGVSRRQFAQKLGWSHSNLADYENGHRMATAEVVQAYESALELSPGSLLGIWQVASDEERGKMRERKARASSTASASEKRHSPAAKRPSVTMTVTVAVRRHWRLLLVLSAVCLAAVLAPVMILITILHARAVPSAPIGRPVYGATTRSDAYWNNQPVATAWFNSGMANPSKGPNSFTLKAWNGASQATLWYRVGGDQPIVKNVYGNGSEISFSVSPSPTRHQNIVYSVCAIYSEHRVCDEQNQQDLVQ